MAFFGSNKIEDGNVPVSTATIITNGTKIKGDIQSNDTVHIEGELFGNIKVDNTLVIGKTGLVKGDIQAQKIISSGKIDGTIKCNDLEVMKSSYVGKNIEAKKILTYGTIDGEIICEALVIEAGGLVKNKTQSKYIVVNGTIEGEIACSTLTVKQTGLVKGNMCVNNISNDGGRIEGSISTFKEIISTIKPTEKQVQESDTQDVQLKQAKK